MASIGRTILAATTITAAFAHPVQKRDSTPVPGESNLYNTYMGKASPYPGNLTSPILPTSNGTGGADDLLFQNLLGAEWVVHDFYQQAVEAFNTSSFTALGLPNTTYDRITEIRNNEAGHLNIFISSISDASIKPGPCKYNFGFNSDPETWLALQTLIEVASMAFLTGLVQQSAVNGNRAALLAVAEVETRHETWALIDVWNTDPFSGPSDTVFPYANEILDVTNRFVINGSCPAQDPIYPYPRQNLPTLDFNRNTSTGHVGSDIEFLFTEGSNQPAFVEGKDYYVVYFHGLYNITVPFDPSTNKSTVPAVFDQGKGLIAAVISDEPGAPELESVLAGPLLLIEQPTSLTQSI